MASDTSAAENGHTHARLALLPLRYTKTIWFVRHAEGYHNIGFEQNQDAHLTPYGWEQCAALRKHIASLTPPMNLQLVVCSPLVRTLETASGVFGGGPAQPGMPLLMAGQEELADCTAAHTPIACTPNVPFVACELCRERMSSAACDRRQPTEVSVQAFPGVDFSEVRDVTDCDEMWVKANVDTSESEAWGGGEPSDAATARGRAFLQWLMRRPETRIAVVAHADILCFTCGQFGADFPLTAQTVLRGPFANCEMRCMLLTDIDSQPSADATHFPGGQTVPRQAQRPLP